MTDYEVGDTTRVSVLLGHTGCCQLRGKRDVSEHDERNPAAKVQKESPSEHQNRACECGIRTTTWTLVNHCQK